MPSLLQMLKDKGVTLPDDLNLSAMVEESDEVKGLKSKNVDLLEWQVKNKPLLESLQQEKEALTAKQREDEEKILKLAQENGDFQKVAEINSKRLKELEDGLNASRDKAKQSAHEAALQSVASLFTDKALGADIAATKAFTELNETGDPVTKFRLGDQEFDSVDGLKEAMAKVPSYAAAMPVGGANNAPHANGSSGNPSGGKNQAEKSTAEILYGK
jgi:hypothetical protein